MLTRTRCVCVCASSLAWVAWLGVTWAIRTNAASHPLMLFSRDVTQMLAGVLTMGTILAFVVAPRIGMALAWRTLGAEEQRRRCACGQRSNLIPVDFSGDVRPVKAADLSHQRISQIARGQ